MQVTTSLFKEFLRTNFPNPLPYSANLVNSMSAGEALPSKTSTFSNLNLSHNSLPPTQALTWACQGFQATLRSGWHCCSTWEMNRFHRNISICDSTSHTKSRVPLKLHAYNLDWVLGFLLIFLTLILRLNTRTRVVRVRMQTRSTHLWNEAFPGYLML